MAKSSSVNSEGSGEMEHRNIVDKTRAGYTENRTRWQRIEDWIWYSNHSMFEYQTNQFIKASQETKTAALWFRRFLMLMAFG
jgi:hypothetical protein